MPDQNGRHKVGDIDPAGRKALKDAMAGIPTDPVAPVPAAPPRAKPSRERRYGPSGQTVDEIVDEAVTGRHANQHTDDQQ